jgi:DNA-binding FrmR family transcriptional regulator
MAKYGYSDTKPQVLKRLSRVEGQVRGISRMVSEDKYCIDILTQISAVQAAIDKVALELVREHAKHCMTHTDDVNGTADELVNAIGRMVSR